IPQLRGLQLRRELPVTLADLESHGPGSRPFSDARQGLAVPAQRFLEALRLALLHEQVAQEDQGLLVGRALARIFRLLAEQGRVERELADGLVQVSRFRLQPGEPKPCRVLMGAAPLETLAVGCPSGFLLPQRFAGFAETQPRFAETFLRRR